MKEQDRKLDYIEVKAGNWQTNKRPIRRVKTGGRKICIRVGI